MPGQIFGKILQHANVLLSCGDNFFDMSGGREFRSRNISRCLCSSTTFAGALINATLINNEYDCLVFL